MTAMFVQVPLSVLDAQGLCPSVKLVYMRLLAHRNRKTDRCNPKFSTLARELGISYRTVCRAIKTLREMGAIRTLKTRLSYVFELIGLACRMAKSGKACLAKSGKVKAAPSLLTEPDQMNQMGGSAAAVDVSSSGSPPENERAAAADSHPRESSNPKTNTVPAPPAVAPPPINFAGLARAIGERLIAVHPSPGFPYRAFPLIEKILRESPNPEATGEKLWNNHASWMTYWSDIPLGRMIPQLWRWLESGEWEFPAVQRKAPKSETERKEESFIAYYQKYMGGGRK
jgi:DNA-binding Lrp family transcriptional regulator